MLPKNVQVNETGHASVTERVKDARKLLGLIEAEADGPDDLQERLGTRSASFITEMMELFEDYDDPYLTQIELPTARQFFWIRDCYNKLVGVD